MQNHNNNRNHHRSNRPKSKLINFFRTGQIFSTIYQLSLLTLIYILVEKGETEFALRIFSINAAVIAFAFLVSKIERSIFNASKKRRYNNNRRNSNYNNNRAPKENY